MYSDLRETQTETVTHRETDRQTETETARHRDRERATYTVYAVDPVLKV